VGALFVGAHKGSHKGCPYGYTRGGRERVKTTVTRY